MTQVHTALALTVLFLLGASQAAGMGYPRETVFSSGITLRGNDSGVETERCLLVESEEQWNTLLGEHRVGSAVASPFGIDIDFSQTNVVAIFLGTQKAPCRIKAAARGRMSMLTSSMISPMGMVTTVRLQIERIESDARLESAGMHVFTPYAFVFVPKSARVTIIEQIDRPEDKKYLTSPTVELESKALNPRLDRRQAGLLNSSEERIPVVADK